MSNDLGRPWGTSSFPYRFFILNSSQKHLLSIYYMPGYKDGPASAPPQSCLVQRGQVSDIGTCLALLFSGEKAQLVGGACAGQASALVTRDGDSAHAGSCGQRTVSRWPGTVVPPPRRWPVRRPCQPCTTFCRGPSSVRKVPPQAHGRLCDPDSLLLWGLRQSGGRGRGSTCATVNGVPGAPAVPLA